MTNGSDEQLRRGEHLPIEESGEIPGRSVAVETGSNGASSSSLLDPTGDSIGVTSEWDTYIDTQIRDGWSDLGHDEQAFCDEYLENGYSHRNAAVSVERPAASGIRLINKPLCREYILHAQNKKRARSIITEQFLEAQHFQLLDEANGDTEVAIVTGAGQSLNAKKYNGPLKLAVLQEMGKVSGITKPDAAALGGVTVILDMGALTGADHKPKIVSEQ